MPEQHPHTPQKKRTLPPWANRGIRFFILSGVMCAGVFTAWALLVSLPSVQSFENRRVSESTKIYDRTGNILLYDVHGTMRRTEVPLTEISPFIQNSTVAIEDAEFYNHFGFRPLSFLRAVLVNLRIIPGIIGQGGSTITQQVVKNTLLTQDKTLIRKAKEIVLAIKLERIATKEEILQIYLNETSYGGTIYGVEEASQYFFGKHAKDVTLAEAAYLAALPQAPTRYSPHGNHRDELEDRKNLVLSRMEKLGYITADELAAAKAEQVTFRQQAETGIKAPHFVFYVREYLEEKYGADAVANEGLRVITSLDWDLQMKAEEIVRDHALKNAKNFNAENAGLVAIDPKTGQILAMVGSRGYFDEEIDGKVNVTIADRQPGSSFKPFVYAAAFEKGYTPETVLFDLRTQFSTSCSIQDLETHDNCYAPVNYDNVFRGPVSLKNALAQSINVPAVKLLYLVGLDSAVNLAERLGISSLGDPARYGLTLVLGGGEVKLLEMVSAYATFASEGERHPVSPILEIADSHRTVLERFENKSERVLDPQVARQITDVLSDNDARAPAFGETSSLHFPGIELAAKTGTTNDYRDAWIVGYTPSLAVGAWAGNNNNEPMEKRVAGFIVAPMWHDFFEYALTKYTPEPFSPPAPDPEWDSLPPVLRGEWAGDPRGIHEILFWVDKNNPRSGVRGYPSSDGQYPYWEYPVSLWSLGQIGSSTPIMPGSPLPQNGITITSPQAGSTVLWGFPFQASVSAEPTLGVTQVSYYLNNGFVGASAQPPYTIAVQPGSRGPQVLRAVADTSNGQVETTITVVVQ